MKTTCPCCRSSVEAELPIVDLNTNTLAFGGAVIHLPPQQAEIATVLLDRFPGVATYDTLIRRIWGVAEPEQPLLILKVLKNTLCRKLRGIGFDVINTPHVGYRLEKAA